MRMTIRILGGLEWENYDEDAFEINLPVDLY
jgi:hypothetical protein